MGADSGIGEHFQLSRTEALTITTFLAISVYNTIELFLKIFMSFKHRSHLYFWSLVISTGGITLYALGFFFKYFDIIPQNMVFVTLIVIGWCCMVTGQSLVLYSRLHLILHDQRTLRWVLIMIIFDAVICHIPITVLIYGANSPNPTAFLTPYSIYEKVQVSIFFIQECIISGLYLWKTIKIIRPEGNVRGKAGRAVMMHLIYMNVIIIVMDITLLSVEYAGYYFIQTTYKAFVYSVKLKMEFSILNKLIKLVRGKLHGSSSDPRSQPYTNHTRTHTQAHTGVDNLTNLSRKNENVGVTTSIALGPYNSSKHNSNPHSPEPGQDFSSMGGVLKTTNVTIERSSDPDYERQQYEEGSGEVTENTNSAFSSDGIETRRESAASSSEVQFARNGF
ncbi:hypothetical protein FQN54_000658 [Arachnomyces sp. PD_36]|nr:hypothetical protein FQN54_000658 [Arachnomyces sp. PD_36]